MAAYNCANYIAEAIRSVISQTYQDWELIIVNDGSTDSTTDIVKEFSFDSRIKLINQENKGQCAASNNAYLQSTGDYIKFLDADDLLAPEYLSEMIKKCEGQDNMLFSHCVNFQDSIQNGSEYVKEDWQSLSPVEFLLHSSSNMRQGGRWLIPRKIIEAGGLWNESLSLINDYEYFTRLVLAAKNIIYVPAAVLYYRQVPNSLSGQKTRKAYLSAYNSISLAASQLLRVEDSERVRARIANAYQDVLFNMYPAYPDLINSFEEQIQALGGASADLGGGPMTHVMNKLIGWKATKRIKQHIKKIVKQT